MNEKGKPFELNERLLVFGKRAMEICKKLPNYPECQKLRYQLGGAATSIGANFEEADGAVSKKDFINKVSIARKEAKEAKYFLRIASGTFLDPKEIADDIKESEEIIKILSSILLKSTNGRRT